MIGRSFGWAVRTSIIHPPSGFCPGIYCQFNGQGKQRRHVRDGDPPREFSDAFFQCAAYRITGIAACCARAVSGHAAAPPSSVMNSRRFTAEDRRIKMVTKLVTNSSA
jgi:hypothetical protein